MTAVTDDFARADNPDLGANWSVVGTQEPFQIISQEATRTTDNADAAEVYVTGSFADDQYSEAAVANMTTSTTSGAGIGVCVRGTAGGSDNMYRAVVNAAVSNNIEVMKFISGSSTSLGFLTQAFSDGDVLRLEVEGQDAAIVLRVKRNGIQIGGDVADSSGSHLNSGRPGVAYSSAVGDVPTLDDWGGGDFVEAVDTTTRRYLIRRSRMTSW